MILILRFSVGCAADILNDHQTNTRRSPNFDAMFGHRRRPMSSTRTLRPPFGRGANVV